MLIFRHFHAVFSSLIIIAFTLSFALSDVNASIEKQIKQEVVTNNWVSFIEPILNESNSNNTTKETIPFKILKLSIKESKIRKNLGYRIRIGKRKSKTHNVLDKAFKRKKSPEENNINKIIEKYSKNNIRWRPKGKQLRKIYQIAINQNILTKKALRNSFRFYEKNVKRKRLSKKYIVIADYTKYSTKKRLHLISLKTGKIKSFFVSHAIKSGPIGGKVLRTSNKVGSNQTSKGFFKVGYREGLTATKKYNYLTVIGLEKKNRKVGWPSRLGGRDVIIHTAKYANTGGRSEGCFVIRPKDKRAIFNRIKGSLFYSYVG